MLITDELFELRSRFLKESLIEAKINAEHMEKWIRIDGAFRSGIVKKSLTDCEKRYNTDSIQAYEDPYKKVA